VKSAAMVVFVFSKANDACSRHIIVEVLFKRKASCTGQMEDKAFTNTGTAV